MAWTAPKTWAVNELVTASLMNTHVRDNLNYLFARAYDVIILPNSANYTTTGTSFADIDGTNLAISQSLAGTKALLFFSGRFNGAAGAILLDFFVNGVQVGTSAGGIARVESGATDHFAIMSVAEGLTPGTNTFTVRWRMTAGTGTLYNAAGFPHPVFIMLEI
jgi:hypothetical protein